MNPKPTAAPASRFPPEVTLIIHALKPQKSRPQPKVEPKQTPARINLAPNSLPGLPENPQKLSKHKLPHRSPTSR